MDVYVVIAERGQYDERREWPAAVFMVEAQAADYAAKATADSEVKAAHDWDKTGYTVYRVPAHDQAPAVIDGQADEPLPVWWPQNSVHRP